MTKKNWYWIVLFVVIFVIYNKKCVVLPEREQNQIEQGDSRRGERWADIFLYNECH
jgi:hypothetical protein